MFAQLTMGEKRCIDNFLKSVNETKLSPGFPFFYSSVISIAGLILFCAATIITLNNFSDRVVYWILFPGLIGGVGIMLLGIFGFKHLKKVEESKKLATIIKKLLN